MLDAGATRALSGTLFTDVREHESIDSTNTEAVRLAREGAPEGLVVIADHQLAGRGRLDRTWMEPPGSSLLISVLFRPALSFDRAHLLALSMGMAAIDASGEVAGVRPLLKWPNDLVAGEPLRKIAGILVELIAESRRLSAVVVGLGMNVNWPDDVPEDLVGVAGSLNHLAGRSIDRGELCVSLLKNLDRRYRALSTPGGDVRLLDDVRAASATLGREVRAYLPDGATVVGIAERITDDGHLTVREGSGALHEITAGDVVHIRPV